MGNPAQFLSKAEISLWEQGGVLGDDDVVKYPHPMPDWQYFLHTYIKGYRYRMNAIASKIYAHCPFTPSTLHIIKVIFRAMLSLQFLRTRVKGDA